MGAAALTAVAALAGGLVAVAARDALLSAPRIAGWLSAAVAPLGPAGREGYAPSADEQRRLALLGSAAILGLAVLAAGPGPLAAAELARLAAELELGASTGEALGAMRRRLRSARVDALVTALLSQQGAGGDLAGLMRRLAAAAAERDRVDDEARTATTQARFTGLLVVALPAGATVFAELLEPGFISQVLAEPAAAAMLIMAAALQLVGFAAIRRLGRPAE